MAIEVGFYQVLTLPVQASRQPNSLYFVRNGGAYGETWITGTDKQAYPVGNSAMINALITAAGGTGGGAPGVDGKSVELQNNGTYIQWRQVGAATWTNLVALSAITGADGKSVELQNNSTYIQWRQVGASTWLNLVALAAIKGDPGAPGAPGAPGTGGAASEAVSIKNLGVSGNNTDETTAFQAAINASAGKELLIENMTIRTKAFTVPGNNMRIRGRNSVIKFFGGTQPDIFCYVTGNNKEIIGLEFDMESLAGDPNSGTTVMYFDGCQNVTIDKNKIHDNGHAAIKIVGGSDFIVTNNRIWNTDSAIFALGNVAGGVQNLYIDHNTIFGGTSEGIGVFSHSSAGTITHSAIITNNQIYNKTTSAGFNFCRTIDLLCSNNTVKNCYAAAFLQDTGSGFAYNEFSTDIQISDNRFMDLTVGINNVADDCLIQGNTFKNVGRMALFTNGNVNSSGVENVLAEGVNISNNKFINCGSLQEGWPVVYLTNLRNLVMENNQITRSASTTIKGILFQNTQGRVAHNYMPGYTLEKVSGDTANYGLDLEFKDNDFFDVSLSPSYPLSQAFKWRFINNRYTNFEANPTDAFQDAVSTSGAVTDTIHKRYIRYEYRVVNGSTISSIAASWRGRRLKLISKGALTVNNSGGIILSQSSWSLTGGESIDLWYDGSNWREEYVSQDGTGGA